MALVKLQIDGKRVIADSGRTILEVAREAGVNGIPTLCHDDRIEPFASCFVCVVKVAGARTLLPACATKVAAGMVVETNHPEVRAARKASLELLLSNHYADCVGPCQLACPAGIDIQGYVALAALGKYDDAIRLIKERNPLPAICGRVCTRPCEVTGCRRNLLDEAVGIDYIKRYLADVDLGRREPFRPAVAQPTGKRVAVVGAGPAGLACAYYLAQRGHAVQMFEALPEAGGMLRYGIPEYRLPKDVLDLEVSQILDLGVKLSTNVSLGRDFTVTSLREQGYDAVFLGLGAWESSRMRVQNEDAEGVLSGIDFLKAFGLRKAVPVRGRVLVVGGGNTAIDCARTALRVGAEEVCLVYRRTRAEMPANAMEIHEADQEGVKLLPLVAPVRVITKDGRCAGLECLRMELGEPDASGRRSPKPVRGSEFVLECDYVIAAIGQGTKLAELTSGRVPRFLPAGEVLNLTRWQTIKVDERSFETSVEGVFAGGDVATGAATVVEAVAAGRKAAYAIDGYVRKGVAAAEPVEFFSRREAFGPVGRIDLRSLDTSKKRHMPVLTADERRTTFVEVEQGYSTEDVKTEAGRCQECGCMALFSCDLRRYATEYGVDITRFKGDVIKYDVDRSHPLIELDPNKCVLCGRCVRVCAELVGVTAFGFIHRGFSTIVKPALGGSLLDTGCVSCGLCVGTCPTGAIAAKSGLAKPGPWETRAVPFVCHYCGDGCTLRCEVYGGTIVDVTGAAEGSATRGNHCRSGRFGLRYASSPERLTKALVRAGRELAPVALDDAIQHAAVRLREAVRRFRPEELAVFVSPRLTNEELYLAQKFARVALGTHQVTSFSRLAQGALECPDVLSTATYADVEDAQVVLVVGAQLAEEHFAVDLQVRRALRAGGRLVYIGAAPGRSGALAEHTLGCDAGSEAGALEAVLGAMARRGTLSLAGRPELEARLGGRSVDALAAESGVATSAVEAVAELLARCITRVVILDKDSRAPRRPGDERRLADAAACLGAGVLALRAASNAQGAADMGVSPSWLPGYASLDDGAAVERFEKEWCVVLKDARGGQADVAEVLAQRRIRVAVVLGEDPLGAEGLPRELRDGLGAAELLIVGDVWMTATARAAHVVLPLSALFETSGTVTSQERRVQRVERATAPPAGLETWQLLGQLAARMGYRFKLKYAGPEEVFDEIRRVIPAYAGVALGAADSSAIWELPAEAPLRRPPFDPAVPLVEPLSTAGLDVLGARLERWFGELAPKAPEPNVVVGP